MSGLHEALGPGREFEIIRRILDSAAGPDRSEGDGSGRVRVGPGDDAAVVRLGDDLVVSTDLSVEDVHYRAEWISPREVGYRAATAALSDVAAMAARPVGVLLSLVVEPDRAADWGPEIGAGVGAALTDHGGVLLGGDVSRAGPGSPVVLDVVAVGVVTHPVTRAGSRVGDEVWVTGTLGGSAAAVLHWTERALPPPDPLRRRFAAPRARVEEAAWLAGAVDLHAMIDVSDGLASDLGHLAAASGLRLELDAGLVPVDVVAQETFGSARARTLALTGGEDYELAFVTPAGAVAEVAEAFVARFGSPLTRVGEVTTGTGLDIVGSGAETIPTGFDHFEDRS